MNPSYRPSLVEGNGSDTQVLLVSGSDLVLAPSQWSSHVVENVGNAMLGAQQVQTAACTPVIVGNASVHQYYHILHQSPEHVHRFYQEIRKLGRPEDNGIMSITSTLQAIDKKILGLGYGVISAEIAIVVCLAERGLIHCDFDDFNIMVDAHSNMGDVMKAQGLNHEA